MLEFGFFFIFHLLPLDNWDWCKTGILKVQLWTIMVIVNIRFLNKLYYDKKKQFKSMKFYIWKQQSWTLSHLIDDLMYIGNFQDRISPPVFNSALSTQSLVFCVVDCILLCVHLSLFFWPLYCLSIGLRLPLLYIKMFLYL
jgi:hypothetical protein